MDYLADKYDAVVRFNGGSNAGHTVVIGERKHTFHLIPSGALKGKDLFIGSGVVMDPAVLAEELSLLPDAVKQRLVVDGRCSLVSPMDKEFDRVLEEMRGTNPIGTTRRGIGPSYAMRALRLSPRVADLLAGFDFGPLFSFYSKFGVDQAGMVAWAEDSKRLLESLSGDVSSRVVKVCEGGGSVLYESSQGSLLDLLHGSYPYVTSTHTLTSYIPAALGIPPELQGEPLGVMKCYSTRVGGGPFPSEIQDETSERIRSIGHEYGATTGRPRRVGWLDLVALRYAIKLNGVRSVAVSKLDVLSQIKDFRVCAAYSHLGSETTDFQRSLAHLGEVRPVFESPFTLEGAMFSDGVPEAAKKFVEYIENELGVRVSLLSHGEERSRTVLL